jgi:hypothetical protein
MQDFKEALQNALKQSMENQMNNQTQRDHSKLNNVVNQWDKEEQARKQVATPAPKFEMGKHKVTTNVSRVTFNYVRDNPAQTKTQITEALVKRGYNASSVSTLAAQMVRGGLATMDENGGLSTHLKEYVPIKNGTAINNAKKKKGIKVSTGKIGRPAREGIAALGVQAAPALPKPTHVPTAKPFDVDQLLSTLSFPQAVELFKKLRFMLGEASRGGL